MLCWEGGLINMGNQVWPCDWKDSGVGHILVGSFRAFSLWKVVAITEILPTVKICANVFPFAVKVIQCS